MVTQRRLLGPSGSKASPCSELVSKYSLTKDLLHPNQHVCLIPPLAKVLQEGWGERCFSAAILGGASERFSEQMVRNLSGLYSHHCFLTSFSEP